MTVWFGGLVALIAAAASYWHMHLLAASHGEAWLSWLVPLSVDGLIIVASLVIVDARIASEDPPVLAWLAVWVGIAVSLAANVAAGGDEWVSRLVAAWPPLALAGAYHLVMTRLQPPASTVTEVAAATESADQAEPEPGEPSLLAPDAGDARQDEGSGPACALPVRDQVAELLAAAEHAGLRPPGRGTIARQLGITEHQVRQALEEHRQADDKSRQLTIVGAR